MRMRQVLVATSLDTHRAIALPDDVRAAIVAQHADAHEHAAAAAA